MKIALITDQHFGCREGKEIFHNYFEKFYQNIFFPVLEENNVKTVINLGDTFDRRKYIDYYSLNRAKEYFFQPLHDAGIEMNMLVGNHDIALRNSLEINSPKLLLKEYSNINPIDKPTELSFPGTKFLMVPWICSDNNKECFDAIRSSDADVLCLHADIKGFSMYRGMESHEGFEPSDFDRFESVYSGHFHHRSSKGNITYLGNPVQITHMDQGDVRGFHIFDTLTRELRFIPNTYEMFDRFVYDDTIIKDHKDIDVSTFKEKFVKIVVQRKTDFYQYDQFIDRVYNSGAHEVKVVETITDMTGDEMDESIDIEDTQSILGHYIQAADVSVDRSELSRLISTLYMEALNVET